MTAVKPCAGDSTNRPPPPLYSPGGGDTALVVATPPDESPLDPVGVVTQLMSGTAG